jgi:hypothetical protein
MVAGSRPKRLSLRRRVAPRSRWELSATRKSRFAFRSDNPRVATSWPDARRTPARSFSPLLLKIPAMVAALPMSPEATVGLRALAEERVPCALEYGCVVIW